MGVIRCGARRLFRPSEDLPEDEHGEEACGREGQERQEQGEKSRHRGPDQLSRGDQEIPGASGGGGGEAPEQRGSRLDDPRHAAPRDQSDRPFQEGGDIAHDRSGGDGSRGDGQRRGQGVEQVVHPGDIVGPDLEGRGRRESDQRGPGSDPLEFRRRLDPAVQDGDAQSEKRQEDAESAGRAQADADDETR